MQGPPSVYPTAPPGLQVQIPEAAAGEEHAGSSGKTKSPLVKMKHKARKLRDKIKKVASPSSTRSTYDVSDLNKQNTTGQGRNADLPTRPPPHYQHEDAEDETESHEDDEEDYIPLEEDQSKSDQIRPRGAMTESEDHPGVYHSGAPQSIGLKVGSQDRSPITPFKSDGPPGALQAAPTEYHYPPEDEQPSAGLSRNISPVGSKPGTEDVTDLSPPPAGLNYDVSPRESEPRAEDAVKFTPSADLSRDVSPGGSRPRVQDAVELSPSAATGEDPGYEQFKSSPSKDSKAYHAPGQMSPTERDMNVPYPDDIVKPNPEFGRSTSPLHKKIGVVNEDLAAEARADAGLSSDGYSSPKGVLDKSVPENAPLTFDIEETAEDVDSKAAPAGLGLAASQEGVSGKDVFDDETAPQPFGGHGDYQSSPKNDDDYSKAVPAGLAVTANEEEIPNKNVLDSGGARLPSSDRGDYQPSSGKDFDSDLKEEPLHASTAYPQGEGKEEEPLMPRNVSETHESDEVEDSRRNVDDSESEKPFFTSLAEKMAKPAGATGIVEAEKSRDEKEVPNSSDKLSSTPQTREIKEPEGGGALSHHIGGQPEGVDGLDVSREPLVTSVHDEGRSQHKDDEAGYNKKEEVGKPAGFATARDIREPESQGKWGADNLNDLKDAVTRSQLGSDEMVPDDIPLEQERTERGSGQIGEAGDTAEGTSPQDHEDLIKHTEDTDDEYFDPNDVDDDQFQEGFAVGTEETDKKPHVPSDGSATWLGAGLTGAVAGKLGLADAGRTDEPLESNEKEDGADETSPRSEAEKAALEGEKNVPSPRAESKGTEQPGSLEEPEDAAARGAGFEDKPSTKCSEERPSEQAAGDFKDDDASGSQQKSGGALQGLKNVISSRFGYGAQEKVPEEPPAGHDRGALGEGPGHDSGKIGEEESLSEAAVEAGNEKAESNLAGEGRTSGKSLGLMNVVAAKLGYGRSSTERTADHPSRDSIEESPPASPLQDKAVPASAGEEGQTERSRDLTYEEPPPASPPEEYAPSGLGEHGQTDDEKLETSVPGKAQAETLPDEPTPAPFSSEKQGQIDDEKTESNVKEQPQTGTVAGWRNVFASKLGYGSPKQDHTAEDIPPEASFDEKPPSSPPKEKFDERSPRSHLEDEKTETNLFGKTQAGAAEDASFDGTPPSSPPKGSFDEKSPPSHLEDEETATNLFGKMQAGAVPEEPSPAFPVEEQAPFTLENQGQTGTEKIENNAKGQPQTGTVAGSKNVFASTLGYGSPKQDHSAEDSSPEASFDEKPPSSPPNESVDERSTPSRSEDEKKETSLLGETEAGAVHEEPPPASPAEEQAPSALEKEGQSGTEKIENNVKEQPQMGTVAGSKSVFASKLGYGSSKQDHTAEDIPPEPSFDEKPPSSPPKESFVERSPPSHLEDEKTETNLFGKMQAGAAEDASFDEKPPSSPPNESVDEGSTPSRPEDEKKEASLLGETEAGAVHEEPPPAFPAEEQASSALEKQGQTGTEKIENNVKEQPQTGTVAGWKSVFASKLGYGSPKQDHSAEDISPEASFDEKPPSSPPKGSVDERSPPSHSEDEKKETSLLEETEAGAVPEEPQPAFPAEEQAPSALEKQGQTGSEKVEDHAKEQPQTGAVAGWKNVFASKLGYGSPKQDHTAEDIPPEASFDEKPPSAPAKESVDERSTPSRPEDEEEETSLLGKTETGAVPEEPPPAFPAEEQAPSALEKQGQTGTEKIEDNAKDQPQTGTVAGWKNVFASKLGYGSPKQDHTAEDIPPEASFDEKPPSAPSKESVDERSTPSGPEDEEKETGLLGKTQTGAVPEEPPPAFPAEEQAPSALEKQGQTGTEKTQNNSKDQPQTGTVAGWKNVFASKLGYGSPKEDHTAEDIPPEASFDEKPPSSPPKENVDERSTPSHREDEEKETSLLGKTQPGAVPEEPPPAFPAEEQAPSALEKQGQTGTEKIENNAKEQPQTGTVAGWKNVFASKLGYGSPKQEFIAEDIPPEASFDEKPPSTPPKDNVDERSTPSRPKDENKETSLLGKTQAGAVPEEPTPAFPAEEQAPYASEKQGQTGNEKIENNEKGQPPQPGTLQGLRNVFASRLGYGSPKHDHTAKDVPPDASFDERPPSPPPKESFFDERSTPSRSEENPPVSPLEGKALPPSSLLEESFYGRSPSSPPEDKPPLSSRRKGSSSSW